MLVANGSGAPTTAIKSTSSGTTKVIAYSAQTTPTTDISQQGTGTTEVSGSDVGNVSVTAGTFQVATTSTILRSVGALTIMRHQSFAFLDSFADASIHPAWAQRDSPSESGDVISLDVGAGGDGPDGGDEIRTTSPYGMATAIAHLKQWTDNAVLNKVNSAVWGGLTVYAPTELSINRARHQGPAHNLLEFRNSWADDDSVIAEVDTNQNSDIWLMLQAARDQVAAYYRLTAPTVSDSVFTLLGTATITLGALDFSLAAGEVTENSTNTGTATVTFERIDIYPLLGPG